MESNTFMGHVIITLHMPSLQHALLTVGWRNRNKLHFGGYFFWFLKPGVLKTRGLTSKGFLQQEVLSTTGLTKGVLTNRTLITSGSYNQGFLQQGVLTNRSLTTGSLTTTDSYHGQTGVLKPGVLTMSNQVFLQTGDLKPGVLTTDQQFLQPGANNQGFLNSRVLTSRGSHNQDFLQPRVLTTKESYNHGVYNQGSYN